MKSKSILLFLALVLPVLVFVFLRFFGKNQFKIPVYYELDDGSLPQDCGSAYSFPYAVPKDSVVANTNGYVIFFLEGLSAVEKEESRFQLTRIANEVTRPVPLIFISTDSYLPGSGNQVVMIDSASYQRKKQCVYLCRQNRLVLVDKDQRIRGYYKDASSKEVDRLIMELMILLEQY
jgi:hypothetical protein